MQGGQRCFTWKKPASHNPNEGELAVAAAKKYDRVVQMGNQRRSWPNVIAAIGELKNGIIGRPYFAKTWYGQQPAFDRERKNYRGAVMAGL